MEEGTHVTNTRRQGGKTSDFKKKKQLVYMFMVRLSDFVVTSSFTWMKGIKISVSSLCSTTHIFVIESVGLNIYVATYSEMLTS